MADLDLILGNRGPFLPQDPQDLTLALGAPPGSTLPAVFGATVRFSGAVQAEVVTIPTAIVAATVRFGGAIAAAFDLGLPVYLWGAGGAAWQHGARQRDDHTAGWAQGASVRTPPRSIPWQHGDGVRTPPQSVPWAQGAPVRTPPRSVPWHDGARVRLDRVELPWHDGTRTHVYIPVDWRPGAERRPGVRLPWRDGAERRPGVRLPWRDGRMVETDGGNPWPPPDVEPPFAPPVDLRFCQLWTASPSDALELILGLNPCGGSGVPALVVVPIRKVYIVINDTHLIKLDGMLELPTLGMQLTLDASSWTWGFSATLPADQLVHVAPETDGTPVLLAAVINGTSYYMIVESIQRSRAFNVATITLTGRGKNALLDAPYAVTQAFNNGTDRTAAQLLDDALKLNGVSIGWTVDFGLDDWLVDAGAWSVSGSHMAAALSVAGAAGGYIQPHATADTLRVLPRYPLAPWDWGLVTPDYELPSSVTTQEGISWVEKARYNRVFVSGQSLGVLGQVTRFGTAGDVIAPMVTDPLITEAAAARQRGTAVLSDTGRIATVVLRLPVLPETGIITPGKFVRYNDLGTYRLGIVRSAAVDVGHPEVWQTIGVETHE